MRGIGWATEEHQIVEDNADKLSPAVAVLLLEAGFSRTADSVKAYRVRMGLETTIRFGWSEQEWEIVRASVDLGPSATKRRLAEAGFERSIRAVERAREKAGRPEEPDPRKRAVSQKRAACLVRGYLEHRSHEAGWPILVGKHEERDRQHVRNLLTAMLAAVRAKQSSQEMAA